MLSGHATLVINAAELAHSTSCFVETKQTSIFHIKIKPSLFFWEELSSNNLRRFKKADYFKTNFLN